MPTISSEADFPYCGSRDINAFRLVFSIETFLRRVLRWELYGIFGRQWKDGIPEDVRHEVELRQQREREVIIVDYFQHSPFSFLLTTELEAIICRGPLWEKVFSKFLPPLAILAAEFHKFVAIRNKVSHCRPITVDDYSTLQNIRQNTLKWAARYSQIAGDTAYVGGYLEEFEIANNPAEEARVEKQLSKKDLSNLWKQFREQFQDYSADGISVGLGVVHHHFFFQMRVAGSLPGRDLLPVFDRFQDMLTFIGVGQFGDFIRAFIPMYEGQHAGRFVEELVAAIKPRIGNRLDKPDEQLLYDFGVGQRESVLSEGQPTFVSFIF